MVEKYTPKLKDIKKKLKITPEDRLRESNNLARLGELVYKNYSWKYIANKLSQELNIKVGEKAVKNIYDEYKAKRTEILTEDEELKQDVKNTIIDVDDQLKRINNITNNLLDNLIDDGYEDKDMVLKVVREVRGQIDLQTSLVKKLTEGFDEHKISEQKYIKMSLDNLEQLEKNNYIKILRKPGEKLDPETLQVINVSRDDLEKLNKEKRIMLPGAIFLELID